MSITVLFKIANALEISPEELFRNVARSDPRKRMGKTISARRLAERVSKLNEREVRLVWELVDCLGKQGPQGKVPTKRAPRGPVKK